MLASDSLFDLLAYRQWQDSVVLRAESVPAGIYQLIISNLHSGLQVRSADATPIDGMRVWDMAGRLSWSCEGRALSYEVPGSIVPATAVLVIQVRKGKQTIRKMAMINL